MADDGLTRNTPANRVLWAVIVLGVFVLGLLLWSWNSINALDLRNKDLQAGIASLPSTDQIASLTKRQDDLEAKLAALPPADLSPVQTEVDDLKTALDALETKVAAVPTTDALTALGQRQDDLEAKLAVAAAAGPQPGPDRGGRPQDRHRYARDQGRGRADHRCADGARPASG